MVFAASVSNRLTSLRNLSIRGYAASVTLNPMPPSSFHIPARVVLECIVSVVYKHDSFKGMLSCKKVRFVKKLADEDFTQLNEIGEIPDEEADFFISTPTGGGKADVAGQATPKSTGGGGKASKKQKR